MGCVDQGSEDVSLIGWYALIAVGWWAFLLAATAPRLTELRFAGRLAVLGIEAVVAAAWPILLPIVAGVAFRSRYLE